MDRAAETLVDSEGGRRLNWKSMALLVILPLLVSSRSIAFRSLRGTGATFSVFSMITVSVVVSIPANLLVIIVWGGLSDFKKLFSMRRLWYIIPGFVDTSVFCLYFTGLKYTTGTLGVVTLQSGIVVSAFLEYILLGKRLKAWQISSVVTTVAMVLGYVMLSSGGEGGGEESGSYVGPILIFLAAVATAVFVAIVELQVTWISTDESVDADAESLRCNVHVQSWTLVFSLIAFFTLDLEFVKEHGVAQGLDNITMIATAAVTGMSSLYYNCVIPRCGGLSCTLAVTLQISIVYFAEVLFQDEVLAFMDCALLLALMASVFTYNLVAIDLRNVAAKATSLALTLSTDILMWEHSSPNPKRQSQWSEVQSESADTVQIFEFKEGSVQQSLVAMEEHFCNRLAEEVLKKAEATHEAARLREALDCAEAKAQQLQDKAMLLEATAATVHRGRGQKIACAADDVFFDI